MTPRMHHPTTSRSIPVLIKYNPVREYPRDTLNSLRIFNILVILLRYGLNSVIYINTYISITDQHAMLHSMTCIIG